MTISSFKFSHSRQQSPTNSFCGYFKGVLSKTFQDITPLLQKKQTTLLYLKYHMTAMKTTFLGNEFFQCVSDCFSLFILSCISVTLCYLCVDLDSCLPIIIEFLFHCFTKIVKHTTCTNCNTRVSYRQVKALAQAPKVTLQSTKGILY